LVQLDPTGRNYFGELSKIMAEPGAANALANQSVRSFFDIGAGARSEALRREDQATARAERLDEEARVTQRQIDAEDHQNARTSVEGLRRLALKRAEEIGDDSFLKTFTPEFDKLDVLQQKDPKQVAPKLNELSERLTREANQADIKRKLLRGMTPEEVEALRIKGGGKFGDLALSQVSAIEDRISSKEIIRMQLKLLSDKLETPGLSPIQKAAIEREQNDLLEASLRGGVGLSGRPNPTLDSLFQSSTGKAKGNDVSNKIK